MCVGTRANTAPASVEDPAAVIARYQERLAHWTSVLQEDGYEIVPREPEAIMRAFAGLRDVNLEPFIETYNAEVVPELLADE